MAEQQVSANVDENGANIGVLPAPLPTPPVIPGPGPGPVPENNAINTTNNGLNYKNNTEISRQNNENAKRKLDPTNYQNAMETYGQAMKNVASANQSLINAQATLTEANKFVAYWQDVVNRNPGDPAARATLSKVGEDARQAGIICKAAKEEKEKADANLQQV